MKTKAESAGRPLRRLAIAVATAATLVWLAGCVSTTTGALPETNDDDAAQKYYQLGARYFHNGNYKLARDRLLRAIELKPDLAIAHSVLALTYEQLDNSRLATEQFHEAVRYDPGNYIVRNSYAVFLCGQKSYDDALKEFERAAGIEKNDDPEIALTNAGVCMTSKKNYEQAETWFRKALDAKPSYGEALLQMALLKFETRDFLPARAFLERYLADNKATPDVLFLAMQNEKAQGDKRATTDYANRLLREFPDSAQAKKVLQAGW